MKTENKTENRGGKRKFAGPPHKYAEETVNLTVRVPASKKLEVRQMIKDYLKPLENPTKLNKL